MCRNVDVQSIPVFNDISIQNAKPMKFSNYCSPTWHTLFPLGIPRIHPDRTSEQIIFRHLQLEGDHRYGHPPISRTARSDSGISRHNKAFRMCCHLL